MFEKVMNYLRHYGIHVFRLIYIMQLAARFGKSKPCQQYCLRLGKEKATFNLVKLVLNSELGIMEIW